MRIKLPDVTVTTAASTEAASTMIGALGAYVLAVETTLVDVGVGLTSTYVGLDDRVAVTHMLRAGGPSQFEHDLLERLAGQSHARGCVLDHASQLAMVLRAAGDDDARVDVGDRALARAEDVWR